jgi:hypothetical protein
MTALGMIVMPPVSTRGKKGNQAMRARSMAKLLGLASASGYRKATSASWFRTGELPSRALLSGLSVIGRNEGDRLKSCLQSLVPACDRVVYVDSGSTDDSVTFARSLG